MLSSCCLLEPIHVCVISCTKQSYFIVCNYFWNHNLQKSPKKYHYDCLFRAVRNIVVCIHLFLNIQPAVAWACPLWSHSQQAGIFFVISLDTVWPHTYLHIYWHTWTPCWGGLISVDSLLIWKRGSSSAFWEEINKGNVCLGSADDSRRPCQAQSKRATKS